MRLLRLDVAASLLFKGKTMFNVVLVEPEIPPNTGNIGRTCAATGCVLFLVGKLGFSTDDKHLKRAGLDYWKYIDVRYKDSLEELFENNPIERFHFFTKKASKVYSDVKYSLGDFLVFGRETYGLPDELLEKYPENTRLIPTKNVRSINLSVSAGIATYEALRQNKFAL